MGGDFDVRLIVRVSSDLKGRIEALVGERGLSEFVRGAAEARCREVERSREKVAKPPVPRSDPLCETTAVRAAMPAEVLDEMRRAPDVPNPRGLMGGEALKGEFSGLKGHVEKPRTRTDVVMTQLRKRGGRALVRDLAADLGWPRDVVEKALSGAPVRWSEGMVVLVEGKE